MSKLFEPLTSFFVVVAVKIVCYWQSILSADVISPNLCTHIIYAFIGVNEAGGLFYINPEAPRRHSFNEIALKF